jgi:hypothetical protein
MHKRLLTRSPTLAEANYLVPLPTILNHSVNLLQRSSVQHWHQVGTPTLHGRFVNIRDSLIYNLHSEANDLCQVGTQLGA